MCVGLLVVNFFRTRQGGNSTQVVSHLISSLAAIFDQLKRQTPFRREFKKEEPAAAKPRSACLISASLNKWHSSSFGPDVSNIPVKPQMESGLVKEPRWTAGNSVEGAAGNCRQDTIRGNMAQSSRSCGKLQPKIEIQLQTTHHNLQVTDYGYVEKVFMNLRRKLYTEHTSWSVPQHTFSLAHTAHSVAQDKVVSASFIVIPHAHSHPVSLMSLLNVKFTPFPSLFSSPSASTSMAPTSLPGRTRSWCRSRVWPLGRFRSKHRLWAQPRRLLQLHESGAQSDRHPRQQPRFPVFRRRHHDFRQCKRYA